MLLIFLCLLTLPALAAQTGITDNVQAAYRAGATAAARNDFRAAETEFEKVVQLAPQLAQGHSALAVVLLRLGKVSDAIQEMEKALAIKPDDVPTQTNLALAYEQTGANRKALALFNKLELQAAQRPVSDPSRIMSPAILSAYARSLAATGQVAEAIVKMKAAVADSPQSAELHDALGSLYAQKENWAAALAEFQQSLTLNPRLAATHLHAGVALLAVQRAPGAVTELTRACELAPNNVVAATELGKAYAANNQDDKAIAAFQHAIHLDVKFAEAKYELARALQRNGRNAESVPLLRQVLASEPKNAEAGASLGLAL
ncbi:MAG TPA: tetratricopeptide repeat protein, partial [Candidatus Acidoferrum sp.]